MRLPDETTPDRVALRVQDVDQALAFYTDKLGLDAQQQALERWHLHAPGQAPLIELVSAPTAPRKPQRSTGLYHYALLLPDRASLARIIHRLQAEEATFVGFADHGVSEAAYLQDPEGNGIELYRDRDPESWPRQGDEVAMVTKPLPLEDLLAEADQPAGLAPGTRLGHVHLHAGDLPQAGRFFKATGFAPTQTTYPRALFLAAGTYHHHVGLNDWAGDQAAPEGATGLARVDWSLPVEPDTLENARTKAGLEPDTVDEGIELVDPIGIPHRFRHRP